VCRQAVDRVFHYWRRDKRAPMKKRRIEMAMGVGHEGFVAAVFKAMDDTGHLKRIENDTYKLSMKGIVAGLHEEVAAGTLDPIYRG
jgi:hypothetical protein